MTNANYTGDQMGRVVRALRADRGLTQSELGVAADYAKAGAGLAVLRLEKGRVMPGEERLTKIATSLGLTLEELEERARLEAVDPSAEQDEAPNAQRENDRDRSPAERWERRDLPLKERANAIKDEVDKRKRLIERAAEAFNDAHDAARKNYFGPLIEAAMQVEGAPEPAADESFDDTDTDPRSIAQRAMNSAHRSTRERLLGLAKNPAAATAGGAAAGAAAGGVAAYGTFTAAAAFGMASTGAAISGLGGAAASNATLALLGGGTLASGGLGIAGGTAVLAGIAAAPVGILALSALLWARKRHQEETRKELDAATTELRASAQSFNFTVQTIERSATVLSDIDVHGGRAVRKWKGTLPDLPTAWEDLSDEQQERYLDFVSVAGAQLAVSDINVVALLNSRESAKGPGEEPTFEQKFVDELLAEAEELVERI